MASLQDLANKLKKLKKEGVGFKPALSQAKSNFTGNVRAFANPQTRSDWSRGTQQTVNDWTGATALKNRQSLINQRTVSQPISQRLFRSPQQDENKLLAQGLQRGARTVGTIMSPAYKGAALTNAAFGAGIAKLQGGDVRQSAMEAAQFGPVMGKFAQATNPIISKGLNKLPVKTPKVIQSRIAPATANVIQGVGMDAATGRPTDSTSLGIDALTGLVFGKTGFSNVRPNAKGMTNKAKTVHPQDAAAIDAVLDTLRNKKLSPGDRKKALTTLDRLATHYLPKDQIDKLRGSQKSLNAKDLRVAKEIQKMSMGVKPDYDNGYVLGLMGGQNAKVGKPNFSSVIDKKPRFEIDDSGAKLKGIDKLKPKFYGDTKTYEGRLADVLEHKELFKNYPQLKDADVVINTHPSMNHAHYQNIGGKHTIQVTGQNKERLIEGYTRQINEYSEIVNNPNEASKVAQELNLPLEQVVREYRGMLDEMIQRRQKASVLPGDAKSTLLHEIQHAIQEIEGFARGGNLTTNMNLSKQELAEMNEVSSLLKQVRDSATPLYDVGRSNANPKVKEWALNIIRAGEKDIDDFLKNTPYEQYKRLSGELEARAVQRRMNLTPDQRAKTDPYFEEMKATGTTNPNDYITRFEGGVSASIDPKLKPLYEEARKYKSAEEFANNIARKIDARSYLQARIPEISKIEDGYIYTKDGNRIELAMSEFSDGLRIHAIMADKKGSGIGSKVVNALKEWTQSRQGTIRIDKAYNSVFWKKMGFDGADEYNMGWGAGDGIDKTFLSTRKSQLTDLYNQATKSNIMASVESGKGVEANAQVARTQPKGVEITPLSKKVSDIGYGSDQTLARQLAHPFDSIQERIDSILKIPHDGYFTKLSQAKKLEAVEKLWNPSQKEIDLARIYGFEELPTSRDILKRIETNPQVARTEPKIKLNQKAIETPQTPQVRVKLNQMGVPSQAGDQLASLKQGKLKIQQKPQNLESDLAQMLEKQQVQSGKTIDLPSQKNAASDNIIADARNQIGRSSDEPKRSVKQAIDDFKTQWVDRYYPITKASQTAKSSLKTQGAELRPEYDPEYLVRRLTGAGGIADYRYKTELEPIIKKVEELNIDKTDLDVYLANKRMAGFGSIDREVYGVDPVKSKQIVSALESKYPEIKGLADELYSYQDKGLSDLVKSGFISADDAKAMKSQNPDYSPLYRVMDVMDNYLGLPTRKTMQGTSPIVKLKGSTKKIESPLESVIGNTFKQRAAIEKNNVARSIVDLQNITDLGFKKVSSSGTDTITVWKDGQKEFWQVGTEIAEVAKGVNEESMNLVLKILQQPASLLRQGATGRNPDFMLPNVVRDQLDAAMTSKYGYIPVVDYLRGLSSMMKNDDIYKKWQASGAKIDLGEISGKKSIQKLFDEKKARKGLFSWITAGLDVMGKYSEQPTRVGLFRKAYQKTGNETLAMMESRDATVDFARMGSKMKVANSIIPFLNVQVQGFDKLLRAVKNNPKKVSILMGTYAVLPTVATTVYNLTNHPEEYKEVPQYDKDDNFILIMGRNEDNTVNYVKIPKGNVIPLVANPTQSMIEYAFDHDSQSFKQLALSTLSRALPVIGDGSTAKEIAFKTIGDNLPQAIKPAAEGLLNKSFYKYDDKKQDSKEIVPYYLKNKEPYEQAYEFTPSTYKAIGAVLNMSPLLVQNTMEGYLAGFSKLPTQLVEIAKKTSEGKEVTQNEVPILRRFFARTYPSSASKATEEKPKTPLMERVTGKADASSGSDTPTTNIPQDQETFNEVYKQALSKGTGFKEDYTKIMYDPSLSESEKQVKVQELKDKMLPYAEQLIAMEDKYPERVFEAQIETYTTGGSMNVEDRGDWVKEQLEKAGEDEVKRQELIDRLWDDKVLTSGAKGVATYLKETYGIDVSNYKGTNKKGKNAGKGKGKGKIGKKINVKASGLTPVNVPKSQPVKLNLSTSQAKLPGIKISAPPKQASLNTSEVMRVVRNKRPKKMTFNKIKISKS